MTFPRDPTPDSSLSLLRLGAAFGLDRYARLGVDAFRLRMGLLPAVMARGAEAAATFYVPDRFTRRGALPPTALRSLQDVHSVMALDGAMHRRRKAMFMGLLNGDAPAAVADRFEAAWWDAVPRWRRRGPIRLTAAARGLLTRALTGWAGAPLSFAAGVARAREFGEMIDGAGAIGPRNWRGLWLRRRTEAWARGVIQAQRDGRHGAPDGSAVAVIAAHIDADGNRMSLRAAGEELINCIRPAVATERYVAFAAHALHVHGWRERLDPRDPAALERFAQEVRRFYPFLPAIGGRALRPFTWRGERFAEGAWMLLDLHGSDHDPRMWDAPDRFDPDRFARDPEAAGRILSHGGGEPAVTHRCPGEALTVALIARATRLLLLTPHDAPRQDWTIDPGRLPPLPRDRALIRFL